MTYRHAPAVALCLIIGACGGGGDDDGPAPAPSPDGPPEEPSLLVDDASRPGEVGVVTMPPDATDAILLAEVEQGTRLSVSGDRCPTVGDEFELAVTATPPETEDDAPPATRDVTASVTLTTRPDAPLELISQGDESIALRMDERDIAELVLDLDGESSRTVWIGGFGADAPADALMRKPVEGGCLFALRLGSTFCGTARSIGGGSGAFGTGDTVVDLDGCDYEAPEGLAVIELEPSGE